MTGTDPLDIRAAGGGCLLRLRVKPKAGAERIIGRHGGALKLAVKEAPEDGKANRAVCRFLARALGLPPAAITLVSGAAAQDKAVKIEGIGPGECRRRLEALLGRAPSSP